MEAILSQSWCSLLIGIKSRDIMQHFMHYFSALNAPSNWLYGYVTKNSLLFFHIYSICITRI